MKESLGLVEIRGLSTAILVADTMAKTANVSILEIENTRGLGYMTIKVLGDVGAVKAAVDSGKSIGIKYDCLISAKVIPRPSEYIEKHFYGAGIQNQAVKKEADNNPQLEDLLKPEETPAQVEEVKTEEIPTQVEEVKPEEEIKLEEETKSEEEIKPEEAPAQDGEPKSETKNTKTTSTRRKSKTKKSDDE